MRYSRNPGRRRSGRGAARQPDPSGPVAAQGRRRAGRDAEDIVQGGRADGRAGQRRAGAGSAGTGRDHAQGLPAGRTGAARKQHSGARCAACADHPPSAGPCDGEQRHRPVQYRAGRGRAGVAAAARSGRVGARPAGCAGGAGGGGHRHRYFGQFRAALAPWRGGRRDRRGGIARAGRPARRGGSRRTTAGGDADRAGRPDRHRRDAGDGRGRGKRARRPAARPRPAPGEAGAGALVRPLEEDLFR